MILTTRLASREFIYEGKSVFSIIAEDKQNNIVEIFPQFIQDNGQYLSIAFVDQTINGGMNTWNQTPRYTVFYNLDSFKTMEIRSNGKIWLVKFDCTNNFFGSEFKDDCIGHIEMGRFITNAANSNHSVFSADEIHRS